MNDQNFGGYVYDGPKYDPEEAKKKLKAKGLLNPVVDNNAPPKKISEAMVNEAFKNAGIDPRAGTYTEKDELFHTNKGKKDDRLIPLDKTSYLTQAKEFLGFDSEDKAIKVVDGQKIGMDNKILNDMNAQGLTDYMNNVEISDNPDAEHLYILSRTNAQGKKEWKVGKAKGSVEERYKKDPLFLNEWDTEFDAPVDNAEEVENTIHGSQWARDQRLYDHGMGKDINGPATEMYSGNLFSFSQNEGFKAAHNELSNAQRQLQDEVAIKAIDKVQGLTNKSTPLSKDFMIKDTRKSDTQRKTEESWAKKKAKEDFVPIPDSIKMIESKIKKTMVKTFVSGMGEMDEEKKDYSALSLHELTQYMQHKNQTEGSSGILESNSFSPDGPITQQEFENFPQVKEAADKIIKDTGMYQLHGTAMEKDGFDNPVKAMINIIAGTTQNSAIAANTYINFKEMADSAVTIEQKQKVRDSLNNFVDMMELYQTTKTNVGQVRKGAAIQALDPLNVISGTFALGAIKKQIAKEGIKKSLGMIAKNLVMPALAEGLVNATPEVFTETIKKMSDRQEDIEWANVAVAAGAGAIFAGTMSGVMNSIAHSGKMTVDDVKTIDKEIDKIEPAKQKPVKEALQKAVVAQEMVKRKADISLAPTKEAHAKAVKSHEKSVVETHKREVPIEEEVIVPKSYDEKPRTDVITPVENKVEKPLKAKQTVKEKPTKTQVETIHGAPVEAPTEVPKKPLQMRKEEIAQPEPAKKISEGEVKSDNVEQVEVNQKEAQKQEAKLAMDKFIQEAEKAGLLEKVDARNKIGFDEYLDSKGYTQTLNNAAHIKSNISRNPFEVKALRNSNKPLDGVKIPEKKERLKFDEYFPDFRGRMNTYDTLISMQKTEDVKSMLTARKLDIKDTESLNHFVRSKVNDSMMRAELGNRFGQGEPTVIDINHGKYQANKNKYTLRDDAEMKAFYKKELVDTYSQLLADKNVPESMKAEIKARRNEAIEMEIPKRFKLTKEQKKMAYEVEEKAMQKLLDSTFEPDMHLNKYWDRDVKFSALEPYSKLNADNKRMRPENMPKEWTRIFSGLDKVTPNVEKNIEKVNKKMTAFYDKYLEDIKPDAIRAIKSIQQREILNGKEWNGEVRPDIESQYKNEAEVLKEYQTVKSIVSGKIDSEVKRAQAFVEFSIAKRKSLDFELREDHGKDKAKWFERHEKVKEMIKELNEAMLVPSHVKDFEVAPPKKGTQDVPPKEMPIEDRKKIERKIEALKKFPQIEKYENGKPILSRTERKIMKDAKGSHKINGLMERWFKSVAGTKEERIKATQAVHAERIVQIAKRRNIRPELVSNPPRHEYDFNIHLIDASNSGYQVLSVLMKDEKLASLTKLTGLDDDLRQKVGEGIQQALAENWSKGAYTESEMGALAKQVGQPADKVHDLDALFFTKENGKYVYDEDAFFTAMQKSMDAPKKPSWKQIVKKVFMIRGYGAGVRTQTNNLQAELGINNLLAEELVNRIGKITDEMAPSISEVENLVLGHISSQGRMMDKKIEIVMPDNFIIHQEDPELVGIAGPHGGRIMQTGANTKYKAGIDKTKKTIRMINSKKGEEDTIASVPAQTRELQFYSPRKAGKPAGYLPPLDLLELRENYAPQDRSMIAHIVHATDGYIVRRLQEHGIHTIHDGFVVPEGMTELDVKKIYNDALKNLVEMKVLVGGKEDPQMKPLMHSILKQMDPKYLDENIKLINTLKPEDIDKGEFSLSEEYRPGETYTQDKRKVLQTEYYQNEDAVILDLLSRLDKRQIPTNRIVNLMVQEMAYDNTRTIPYEGDSFFERTMVNAFYGDKNKFGYDDVDLGGMDIKLPQKLLFDRIQTQVYEKARTIMEMHPILRDEIHGEKFFVKNIDELMKNMPDKERIVGTLREAMTDQWMGLSPEDRVLYKNNPEEFTKASLDRITENYDKMAEVFQRETKIRKLMDTGKLASYDNAKESVMRSEGGVLTLDDYNEMVEDALLMERGGYTPEEISAQQELFKMEVPQIEEIEAMKSVPKPSEEAPQAPKEVMEEELGDNIGAEFQQPLTDLEKEFPAPIPKNPLLVKLPKHAKKAKAETTVKKPIKMAEEELGDNIGVEYQRPLTQLEKDLMPPPPKNPVIVKMPNHAKKAKVAKPVEAKASPEKAELDRVNSDSKKIGETLTNELITKPAKKTRTEFFTKTVKKVNMDDLKFTEPNGILAVKALDRRLKEMVKVENKQSQKMDSAIYDEGKIEGVVKAEKIEPTEKNSGAWKRFFEREKGETKWAKQFNELKISKKRLNDNAVKRRLDIRKIVKELIPDEIEESVTKHILQTNFLELYKVSKNPRNINNMKVDIANVVKRLDYQEVQKKYGYHINAMAQAFAQNENRIGGAFNNGLVIAKAFGEEDAVGIGKRIDFLAANQAMMANKESWAFVNNFEDKDGFEKLMQILMMKEERSKKLFRGTPENYINGWMAEAGSNGLKYDDTGKLVNDTGAEFVEGLIPASKEENKIGKSAKQIKFKGINKKTSWSQRKQNVGYLKKLYSERKKLQSEGSRLRKVAEAKTREAVGRSHKASEIIADTIYSVDSKVQTRVYIKELLQKDMDALFSTEPKDGFIEVDKKTLERFPRELRHAVKYVDAAGYDMIVGRKKSKFLGTNNDEAATVLGEIQRNLVTRFKQNVVLKNVASFVNNAVVGLTINTVAVKNPIKMLGYVPDAHADIKAITNIQAKIAELYIRGADYSHLRKKLTEIPLYQMEQLGLSTNILDGLSDSTQMIGQWAERKAGNTPAWMQTAFNNAMMNEGSAMGTFANKAFSEIDTVSRYTLVRSLVDEGMTMPKAVEWANGLYADMDVMTPRIADQLDKHGAIPFLNWFLNSAPRTISLAKRNPIKFMGMAMAGLALESALSNKDYKPWEEKPGYKIGIDMTGKVGPTALVDYVLGATYKDWYRGIADEYRNIKVGATPGYEAMLRHTLPYLIPGMYSKAYRKYSDKKDGATFLKQMMLSPEGQHYGEDFADDSNHWKMDTRGVFDLVGDALSRPEDRDGNRVFRKGTKK